MNTHNVTSQNHCRAVDPFEIGVFGVCGEHSGACVACFFAGVHACPPSVLFACGGVEEGATTVHAAEPGTGTLSVREFELSVFIVCEACGAEEALGD